MKFVPMVLTLLLLTTSIACSQSDPTPAAKVGDVSISSLKISHLTKNYLMNFESYTKEDSLDIRKQILQTHIDRLLVSLHAISEGYQADTAEVNRYLKMAKLHFQGDSLFNANLKAAGMNVEDWLNDVRNESIAGKYLSEQIKSTIQTADPTFVDSLKSVVFHMEYRLYHILIKVTQFSSVDEIEKAHNQIIYIYGLIENQDLKKFIEVAKKYSEDDRTRTNGGDLGWMRSGKMPKYFEQVVKKTPLNTVSEAVQSGNGLHLVFIAEERETPVSQTELMDYAVKLARDNAYEKLLKDLNTKFKVEIFE